jgi:branched-chain amino acid transport system substrate-binding protein
MTHRRWLATFALVSLLALVGAACSDEESTPGATSTGTGATGAVDCATVEFGCLEVAANEPIKIGTLLAISGDVATLGQDSQNGVRLAIDYLDGSFDATDGQILDHDVELVNEDDLCSADGGQSGATKLAADPQIAAVIGTSCSASAQGVADQILSDKGILLISPSNTAAGLTSADLHQPFYARTAQNDAIQSKVVADFVATELGLTKAATIHDESPYSAGLTGGFAVFFEDSGGSITSDEAIQSTETDFKGLLTSIAQGEPEIIYLPDFNPACALIAKQAKSTPGLEDVALMGSDGCLASTFLDQAGSDGDGFYMSGPIPAPGCPAACALLKEYNAAYVDQYDDPTAAFNTNAFDAFNLVAKAIDSVAVQNDDGSLSIPRTALRDELFATTGYEGISGSLTCNEYGDCQSEAKVNIGVYQSPDIPVKGGDLDAKTLFEEELALADVVS